MRLVLCERRLFRLHLACIGLLVTAHVGAHFLRRYSADPGLHGLWPMFNLNSEHNLPSLFSSLAILVAAALLFATAGAARDLGRTNVAGWYLLGAVFVLLGVDESLSLHELLNRPVREALHLGGAFYFAWVLPYALLLVVLAVPMQRLLWSLEARARREFVVAGLVYVTGALLLEMAGARIWVTLGAQSRAYYLETTLEETLEMLGIALFVRALIGHYRREFETGAVQVAPGTVRPVLQGGSVA